MVRVVRAISVDREGIIWLVDSLILSYQLGVPYYPERCPKKNTFLVKAPLFERLSNFARFQIVKRKISQAVGRRWQPMYYATAAAKSESNGVCFHIFSLDAPSFRYQFLRRVRVWSIPPNSSESSSVFDFMRSAESRPKGISVSAYSKSS
jgi:hypothetical protein